MFLSRNQELLEPVAQFIRCEILASLDWQTFSDTFTAYLRRRRNTPAAYVNLFPTLACLAAGGVPTRAIPVTAAWILFILAARLFDDLTDGQQLAHEWSHFEPATASSMALFALGAANSALAQAGSGNIGNEVTLAFNQALAMAAKSQQQEAQNQNLSVDQYLGNIATKTGFIFAVGAWAGGMVATQEPCQTVVQALHDYGLNVGIMDQIYDDCQDLKSDLAQGVWTLPVYYALSQASEDDSHELRAILTAAKAGDDLALETAVSHINSFEAIPWSLMVAAAYQQRALTAIQHLPAKSKQYLVEYAQRNNAQPVL